jgi:branched-chain amino acid transport system ATP-binding protein
MSTPMLKVSGLKVAYGGIQAVKGVSFEVNEGELVSLIGANGAGKTTTLKAITGTQAVADGQVEYLGKSIKGQGAVEPGQTGPGDGARRARCVCAHDHHREPADGRLRA